MSFATVASSLTHKARAIAIARAQLSRRRNHARKWHRPERLWPLFTKEDV